MEKDVLLKRKTLEMMPSVRDNISKLQELSTAGTQRLLELAQEWDRHRQPMVEMLNEKEDLLNKVLHVACLQAELIAADFKVGFPLKLVIIMFKNCDMWFVGVCVVCCSGGRRVGTWWRR